MATDLLDPIYVNKQTPTENIKYRVLN